MTLDSLESALEALKNGNFIIVLDEHREKEGDFFILAEHITPEKINFLLTHAKGMICVPCGKEVLEKFEIPLMVENNTNLFQTNFCVSVDAAQGITTGVSAPDRAKTISILCNQNASKEDLVMPGHTFPLLAQEGSERFGHTETAIALARKIEAKPVVVIGEILNTQGEIADTSDLLHLSQEYKIPIITLEMVKNMK